MGNWCPGISCISGITPAAHRHLPELLDINTNLTAANEIQDTLNWAGGS